MSSSKRKRLTDDDDVPVPEDEPPRGLNDTRQSARPQRAASQVRDMMSRDESGLKMYPPLASVPCSAITLCNDLKAAMERGFGIGDDEDDVATGGQVGGMGAFVATEAGVESELDADSARVLGAAGTQDGENPSHEVTSRGLSSSQGRGRGRGTTLRGRGTTPRGGRGISHGAGRGLVTGSLGSAAVASSVSTTGTAVSAPPSERPRFGFWSSKFRSDVLTVIGYASLVNRSMSTYDTWKNKDQNLYMWSKRLYLGTDHGHGKALLHPYSKQPLLPGYTYTHELDVSTALAIAEAAYLYLVQTLPTAMLRYTHGEGNGFEAFKAAVTRLQNQHHEVKHGCGSTVSSSLLEWQYAPTISTGTRIPVGASPPKLSRKTNKKSSSGHLGRRTLRRAWVSEFAFVHIRRLYIICHARFLQC